MGTYVYRPEVMAKAEKDELLERISSLVDQVDHPIARSALADVIGRLHNEVDNIKNGWRDIEAPSTPTGRRQRSR